MLEVQSHSVRGSSLKRAHYCISPSAIRACLSLRNRRQERHARACGQETKRKKSTAGPAHGSRRVQAPYRAGPHNTAKHCGAWEGNSAFAQVLQNESFVVVNDNDCSVDGCRTAAYQHSVLTLLSRACRSLYSHESARSPTLPATDLQHANPARRLRRRTSRSSGAARRTPGPWPPLTSTH